MGAPGGKTRTRRPPSYLTDYSHEILVNSDGWRGELAAE
ncbi:hypothetical protein FRUB_04790 [Fimbriiglobus ruber]|uniref:Uncharacterized protein n=1 Tax=Fimbriiglobus ruber TaxID=1908690 RepID=A0A225DQM0_9BACT|nr:hypothetical protein FRUB_04790 [Fimbriiglobus ruber]